MFTPTKELHNNTQICILSKKIVKIEDAFFEL